MDALVADHHIFDFSQSDLATIAALELAAGLMHSSDTRLSYPEWVELLAPLPPRYRRVVILYILHGLTHSEIALRLGGITRSRVHQIWLGAIARLANHPRLLEILGVA